MQLTYRKKKNTHTQSVRFHSRLEPVVRLCIGVSRSVYFVMLHKFVNIEFVFFFIHIAFFDGMTLLLVVWEEWIHIFTGASNKLWFYGFMFKWTVKKRAMQHFTSISLLLIRSAYTDGWTWPFHIAIRIQKYRKRLFTKPRLTWMFHVYEQTVVLRNRTDQHENTFCEVWCVVVCYKR